MLHDVLEVRAGFISARQRLVPELDRLIQRPLLACMDTWYSFTQIALVADRCVQFIPFGYPTSPCIGGTLFSGGSRFGRSCIGSRRFGWNCIGIRFVCHRVAASGGKEGSCGGCLVTGSGELALERVRGCGFRVACCDPSSPTLHRTPCCVPSDQTAQDFHALLLDPPELLDVLT